MLYRVNIEGKTPIIMNNGYSGLDTKSPEAMEKFEITKKRGSNRTEEDNERLLELECRISLWLDDDGKVEIPIRAIRANIEAAARKLKQGPQVREGLMIESTRFIYDEDRYGTTKEELGKSTQFTVPVVVQRARLLRTRAMFEDWSCIFTADADPELVDQTQLERWLKIAGTRVGLGDWRPEKSGQHGRYNVISVEELG